jgi:hypothetical protein
MIKDQVEKELYNIYKSYDRLFIKKGSYIGKYIASFNFIEKEIKFDIICQFDEDGNLKTHTLRFYFSENSFEDVIAAISILENSTAKLINSTIKEILNYESSKLCAVSINMDVDNKIRRIFIDGDFINKPEKNRWNAIFHGEKNIFLDAEDEKYYIVLRHLMEKDETFKEVVENDLGSIIAHNEKNKDEIKKYIEDYKNSEDGFLVITDMLKI